MHKFEVKRFGRESVKTHAQTGPILLPRLLTQLTHEVLAFFSIMVLMLSIFDVKLKSILMQHIVSIAGCMNSFFTTLGPNNSLSLFNKVLKVGCINIK